MPDHGEHVPPTEADLADAAAIVYDPVWWQFERDHTIPPLFARRQGDLRGAGPDSLIVSVPNPFRLDGQPGHLAVIGRAVQFDGEPALLIQTVEIVEGHGQSPSTWWSGLGIRLSKAGWADSVDKSDTSDWRMELTPGPHPSAPVTVTVTDPAEELLFAGPVLAPPIWQVMARSHPQGVQVFAGQTGPREVPDKFVDAVAVELLGSGDLVAARIPLTVHAPSAAIAS